MNVIELCDSVIKAGEGSRGGKIIGHTKSGRPIYEDHNHPSHKKFTVADHNDASDAQLKHGAKLRAEGKPKEVEMEAEEKAESHRMRASDIRKKNRKPSKLDEYSDPKSPLYGEQRPMRMAKANNETETTMEFYIEKATPKGVDEAKYKRCKEKVKAKQPGVNEYAVCTASLKRSMKRTLKDTEQALVKGLFPKPVEESAVKWEPNKAHYESQMKWAIKRLEELKQMRWTIERDLPDLKDKFEEIYNAIKNEIRGHAKKHTEAKKSLGDALDDLCKATAGEGSRGGTVIGHTESGKPIYAKSGSKEHKGFTAQDHYDAGLKHSWHADRKSEEYHRQGNGDGTISAKGIKKQKQLRKQIEEHRLHAAKHRSMAEKLEGKGSSSGPDQRDFDRMDRQGDKDRRSRGWRSRKSLTCAEALNDLCKAGEGSRGGKVIGHTRSGKPIYAGGNDHAGFSTADHADAMAVHHTKAGEYGRNTKTAQKHRELSEAHESKVPFAERPRGNAGIRAHMAEHKLSEGPSRREELDKQAKDRDEVRQARGQMQVRGGEYFRRSVSDICDDIIKAGA